MIYILASIWTSLVYFTIEDPVCATLNFSFVNTARGLLTSPPSPPKIFHDVIDAKRMQSVNFGSFRHRVRSEIVYVWYIRMQTEKK